MRHYLATVVEFNDVGYYDEWTFVLAGEHPAQWLARRVRFLRGCGHDKARATLRFYRPISAEMFAEVESTLTPPPMVLPA